LSNNLAKDGRKSFCHKKMYHNKIQGSGGAEKNHEMSITIDQMAVNRSAKYLSENGGFMKSLYGTRVNLGNFHSHGLGFLGKKGH
jgi:hypothetical protein